MRSRRATLPLPAKGNERLAGIPELGGHVGRGPALKGAVASLDQPVHGLHLRSREPRRGQLLARDLRRGERAPERGREDPPQARPLRGEPRPRSVGLGDPELGERRVAVALHAALQVELGLPVAEQVQARHARGPP